MLLLLSIKLSINGIIIPFIDFAIVIFYLALFLFQ